MLARAHGHTRAVLCCAAMLLAQLVVLIQLQQSWAADMPSPAFFVSSIVCNVIGRSCDSSDDCRLCKSIQSKGTAAGGPSYSVACEHMLIMVMQQRGEGLAHFDESARARLIVSPPSMSHMDATAT